MAGEDKKKLKDHNASNSAGKQPQKPAAGSDSETGRRNSKKTIKGSKSVRPNAVHKDVMRGEDFLRRAGFKDGGRPGKLEAIERMKDALLEKEKKRKERAKSRGRSAASAKKHKKDKADRDQKVHDAKRNSSKPKKDPK